jgi:phage tail tape-measure protein
MVGICVGAIEVLSVVTVGVAVVAPVGTDYEQLYVGGALGPVGTDVGTIVGTIVGDNVGGSVGGKVG